MFFIIVTNNEAFFCKSLCLLLSLFGSLAITRHAEVRCLVVERRTPEREVLTQVALLYP